MSLSPTDRDLLNIKVNTRPDHVLAQLYSDALSGIDRAIAVLTNGMTVYGRITSFSAMAEALDEDNVRRYDVGLKRHPESWGEIDRELFTARFTRQHEREQADRVSYFDRTADTEFDDLSDEDQREYLDDRESTITIAAATVFPPGAPHFEVPVMRVQIASVNAWWLVPTDEDGKTTISHPSVG